ncbi:hypothetical protein C8J57DRAFT_1680363 [Mycena rebaudengoi]|nr:hypothetical protein C8J57DRAFT_1680363 [Mycena rebaudengoi]
MPSPRTRPRSASSPTHTPIRLLHVRHSDYGSRAGRSRPSRCLSSSKRGEHNGTNPSPISTDRRYTTPHHSASQLGGARESESHTPTTPTTPYTHHRARRVRHPPYSWHPPLGADTTALFQALCRAHARAHRHLGLACAYDTPSAASTTAGTHRPFAHGIPLRNTVRISSGAPNPGSHTPTRTVRSPLVPSVRVIYLVWTSSLSVRSTSSPAPPPAEGYPIALVWGHSIHRARRASQAASHRATGTALCSATLPAPLPVRVIPSARCLAQEDLHLIPKREPTRHHHRG